MGRYALTFVSLTGSKCLCQGPQIRGLHSLLFLLLPLCPCPTTHLTYSCLTLLGVRPALSLQTSAHLIIIRALNAPSHLMDEAPRLKRIWQAAGIWTLAQVATKPIHFDPLSTYCSLEIRLCSPGQAQSLTLLLPWTAQHWCSQGAEASQEQGRGTPQHCGFTPGQRQTAWVGSFLLLWPTWTSVFTFVNLFLGILLRIK